MPLQLTRAVNGVHGKLHGLATLDAKGHAAADELQELGGRALVAGDVPDADRSVGGDGRQAPAVGAVVHRDHRPPCSMSFNVLPVSRSQILTRRSPPAVAASLPSGAMSTS